MFQSQLDQDVFAEIRAAVIKGLAMGNDRFEAEIEKLTGRRVTSRGEGPKQKRLRISHMNRTRDFLL